MKFFKRRNRLILSYTADIQGANWIYDKLDSVGQVTIAKRFEFIKKDLVTVRSEDPTDEFEPVEFVVAIRKNGYFRFKKRILGLENALYIAADFDFSRKKFLAQREISVFGRIDAISSENIYIGGENEAAIPVEEFENLLTHFPTSGEMDRYAKARITGILGDYLNPKEDYLGKYQKIRNRRGDVRIENLAPDLAEFEFQKYDAIHHKLRSMLNNQEKYSEHRWQSEIVDILQLIYPKYVGVFSEPPVLDSYAGKRRRVDFLLVDADGTIDLAEIKKPSENSLVSRTTYRDNHIPVRELSGSIMQLEKYILYLNRWGAEGERKLNEKYASCLGQGIEIKITNPNGIVIAGRSTNLTLEQKLDFEVVRRKYKNLIDIITYDDLLFRLERIIERWKAHT